MSGQAARRRAVVVGAGIGGLTTALSLHAIAIDVDVFEASPEIGALGVGINLLPHAVRELDALGQLDRLLARGVMPECLTYFNKHGQEIWREPRGKAAGYPWPQLSIHRGELQRTLLEAAEEALGTDRIHRGHRLVRIEDSGARPTAIFENATIDADLVVAADGIHSTVRRQHYPDEGAPLWNGALLWRGTAQVPPLLDGRTLVWAGHPDQKFIAYPIRDLANGLQEINFIAERRSADSGLASREDWNRSGDLNDFLPAFTDWRFDWLDVPGLVRAAPTTYLFPMIDRDPLPRWTFSRITLLGDAAHPMYPIGSNGASQAILDARVLAGCLRKYGPDVEHALFRYEAARRPATARLVEANRRFGPEAPMKLVEERAPDGFAAVTDVISEDEILSATEGYRKTAGFALAALQQGTSVADDPDL